MLYFDLIYILVLIYLSYRRYRVFMNPFVFEAHYSLLFLVVPQIIMLNVTDLAAQDFRSDLMIFFYVTGVFLGCQPQVKSFRITDIRFPRLTGYLNIFAGFLLLIPTLSILFGCGLSLMGVRCYYETVVFSKFASFYDLGKTFLLIGVMVLLAYRKRFNLFILTVLFFLIFSGSKFAIFNFLIFLFIFLEEYKNVSLKKIFLLAIPVFFLLIIYHAAQMSYGDNAYLTALTYFDIYQKQSFLAEELAKPGTDFYFGEIFISSFYKYIPRILWESKPYAYGFAILNYDFLPELAAVNYMPSFGLGVLYADFWYVGVFVFGAIAGFFRQYCYQIFLRSGKNSSSLILYYYGFSFLTIGYLLIQSSLSNVLKFFKKEE